MYTTHNVCKREGARGRGKEDSKKGEESGKREEGGKEREGGDHLLLQIGTILYDFIIWHYRDAMDVVCTCCIHILLDSELGGSPSSLSAGQLSKTDISFLLSHSLKLTQSP